MRGRAGGMGRGGGGGQEEGQGQEEGERYKYGRFLSVCIASSMSATTIK
jgi:hypothetical protein